MAFVLQHLSKQMQVVENGEVPPVIVAAVGFGHQDGIIEQFAKDIPEEVVKDLVKVPFGPARAAPSEMGKRNKLLAGNKLLPGKSQVRSHSAVGD